MNNPIVMILLLGMLLLLIASPFSLLSLLMLIAFGAVLVWTIGSILGAVFPPDHPSNE